MQLSVRGFLVARFIAMVSWVLLLAAGFGAWVLIEPAVNGTLFEVPVWLVTLAGPFVIGFLLQRKALSWLDPHGLLRAEVQQMTHRPHRG